MEITIVGAGIGGLAAAVAATRAGHAVTVLESAAQLRDNGTAIALLANAVRALDELGLGADTRAQAVPDGVSADIRDRHGRVLMAPDPVALAARTGAPLVVAARTWLHQLLAAQLPDGAVRTGVSVDDVRSLPGDAVIAADGAGSLARARLFPAHPGLRGSGELALRGIAPGAPAGVPVVHGELLDHRTGERSGAMTMRDGRVYWYAAWHETAVGGSPGDPAELLRWLVDRRRDWHPSIAPMVASTPPESVHLTETVQLAVPLKSFAVDRVALLGDAAHAMTPDIAQGGGQALEDAAVLQRLLRGATASDVARLLARYSTLRARRTRPLLAAARAANRVLTLRGPAARLRDAAMRAVPRAAVTAAMARQLRFDPG